MLPVIRWESGGDEHMGGEGRYRQPHEVQRHVRSFRLSGWVRCWDAHEVEEVFATLLVGMGLQGGGGYLQPTETHNIAHVLAALLLPAQ